ncbi:MAG TPA: aminotransferase class IV [Chryseosolibacter sp.]|nr:aminotransferase class IV [Chryseosolibacter sp.]
MSRLIESIKLLDGKFYNLFYHEQRMKRSLQALFGDHRKIDLEKFLRDTDYPRHGLYKCRIVYDANFSEASFSPYEAKRVERVKVVEDDDISYEFKFLDRSAINRLFDLRGDCDDVLIVRKGMVTDCSFSNVVFKSDGGVWYTPRSPLLEGTMRRNLLDQNRIQVREIQKRDIRSFDTFKIINAMLEFDSPEIEVSNIVF